jgi:hypothetical protein
MVLYQWISFNGIFFMQKERINRSICVWSRFRKSIQIKDDRECHLLYFPQEMGIMEEKLVSMTKSQYFVTAGSDLPLLDRRGWERSAKTRFQHLLWCERNKVSVYIYIAFIFQRRSC